ncbi:MAG: lipid-A-disaccharide synthase [Phormidesmis sp.]
MSTVPIASDPIAIAKSSSIDVVILSNGPGEVATWVKPVARSLQQKAPALRISVILSPCPHASGQEPTILQNYPEVDRVQRAPHFFKFLLTGKTADGWDWHPQGVVVFLGGDQAFTWLIGKRLGYRTVIYAEWEARWSRLVDRFGVMQSEVVNKVPTRRQHKFTEVGDLMADVQTTADRTNIAAAVGISPAADLIGFLPGSKPTKLSPGIPLALAIAQTLHSQTPQTQYVIGVAPNLTLADLARYADPAHNPLVPILQAPSATLVTPPTGLPYFQIENGPKVFLWQRFPALDLFSQCALCVTTIGANTAQLGALAVPMIVLLPTQQFDGLKLWDGVPGLLARLPGVRSLARKFINPLIIKGLQKSDKLFAWPNIWAKREVVPELLGPITAQQVSKLVSDYLTHPEKLTAIRQTLRDLRGPAGAADKMADLILETVDYPV